MTCRHWHDRPTSRRITSAWLTLLGATALLGSMTSCAIDPTLADQNTAFTADGHPRVGVSQNTCDDAAGSRQLVRTELYLGTSRAHGSPISEEQYQQFMDQEVTPRFGDTLVLVSARQEPSRILVLLYPYGEQKAAAVQEIVAAFRRSFQQEAIRRVDSRACVVL